MLITLVLCDESEKSLGLMTGHFGEVRKRVDLKVKAEKRKGMELAAWEEGSVRRINVD